MNTLKSFKKFKTFKPFLPSVAGEDRRGGLN